MKIEHKQAFLFIIFLLAIFIIGFAYIILSQPMEFTYNLAYNDSMVQDQVYQDFFIRSKTIWSFVLIIISIGLVWWTVLKIQEKALVQG